MHWHGGFNKFHYDVTLLLCTGIGGFKHFGSIWYGLWSVFVGRHGGFKVSYRESAGIHGGFKHVCPKSEAFCCYTCGF